jgi:TatD DNase family protein
MQLFDSHAHIQGPEFAEDLEEVMMRAREAGVGQIVVPADDLEMARAAIALAERDEGLFATAGVHPHSASTMSRETLDEIEALLRHDKVVALGEIGLDYYRMHSSLPDQLKAFEAQLALAEKVDVPVVIHCRDAWPDMGAILSTWARKQSRQGPLGVMHYFTSSMADARLFVDLGFLISVHTIVTHPRSTELREVVAGLPLEYLVLETDSPYGAPQVYRGRRNEPSYVLEAAKRVAELQGVDVGRVAEVTTENARRLFRLPAGVATDRAE